MEIIPAIDIINGKCVRLTQGNYTEKKIYNENPTEVALRFQDIGIRRLHLVDLDGAKAKKPINLKVLENIADKTNLTVDAGGGIHTTENVREVFTAGAAMITGGSIAATNPELFWEWLNIFGENKIFLGADVKNEKIAISGWQTTTRISLNSFIEKHLTRNIKTVICTSIAKDGMLEGPDFELYINLKNKFPSINIIASGGISSENDLYELHRAGIHGAIVGKAIYENKITLSELQKINEYVSQENNSMS